MKIILSILFVLTFTFAAFGQSNCTYTLNPSTANGLSATPTEGGSQTVTVSTQAGCAWTAVSIVDWVMITSGASGSGSGNVVFSVARNTDARRFTQLTIADNLYGVVQEGIPCTYTFNSPTSPITAAGGASNYSVTKSNPGCHLEERNFDSNVRAGFVEPNSGPGRGLYLRFFVSPTLGGSFGLGTPGGIIQFNLYQAPGCIFTVNNTNQGFDAGGGTGVYQLTTTLPLNQCQSPGGSYGATPRASDSWIILNNPVTAVSTGVNYTVAPNNSTAARTGTIMFQTFFGYDPPDNHIQIITQSGIACVYSLSINAASVPAAASSGTFDMHAPSPCTWAITPNSSWITINLNQNGNGNGTVGYLVAANTGAARIGTINAQGQTFTVNQAGATPTPNCTYTLGTTSQTFTSSGGTGSIDVQTQTGCTWSAANNDSFVTLSKASVAGNGTITFDVAANSSGVTRTSTITVQGQIFTVTQSGGKTRKRVRFF